LLRTFVNVTMYPYPAQQLKKIRKYWFILKHGQNSQTSQ
jgi:hypothetical protein